jgi:hypothetical protein
MVKYVTDPLEFRERYDGTFWEMEEDFTLEEVEEEEVEGLALGVALAVAMVDVAGVVGEDDSGSYFVGEVVLVLMDATFVDVATAATVVIAVVAASAATSVVVVVVVVDDVTGGGDDGGCLLSITAGIEGGDCSDEFIVVYYSKGQHKIKKKKVKIKCMRPTQKDQKQTIK